MLKTFFISRKYYEIHETRLLLKIRSGWGDSSAVNSTGCSYKGPALDSQNPHADSQPSVTPYLGFGAFSDTHAVYRHTHKQSNQTHKINYNLTFI